MQNTSHAVMSQRIEASDSLDDFPTPPWAARALVEHIIEPQRDTGSMTAFEPACGRGHIAQTLREYFGTVIASDIHPYGYGSVRDFLSGLHEVQSVDWVITNPPFRLAEDFIKRSLPIARRGVAMLVRTVFLESVGRYERVFLPTPPSKVAQFVERVPMVKGRVDRKASTATGYAWVVWERNMDTTSALAWVPPCRKALEKATDYEDSFLDPAAISSQMELFR